MNVNCLESKAALALLRKQTGANWDASGSEKGQLPHPQQKLLWAAAEKGDRQLGFEFRPFSFPVTHSRLNDSEPVTTPPKSAWMDMPKDSGLCWSRFPPR